MDRVGVAMGLPFPAGRALDALSQSSVREEAFSVKLDGCTFSLSGMENKIRGMLSGGQAREDVARFTFCTLAHVVQRATTQARLLYGNLPVLCSGGVASNGLLRERLDAIFAPPKYSTDNALGVAILTHRAAEQEGMR